MTRPPTSRIWRRPSLHPWAKLGSMRKYHMRDFPVDDVRRYLEPGPIVLVSSAWRNKTNIMTMGWHMVMGFEPSLIGCYIWDQNHSFNMIRKSREWLDRLALGRQVELKFGG